MAQADFYFYLLPTPYINQEGGGGVYIGIKRHTVATLSSPLAITYAVRKGGNNVSISETLSYTVRLLAIEPLRSSPLSAPIREKYPRHGKWGWVR